MKKLVIILSAFLIVLIYLYFQFGFYSGNTGFYSGNTVRDDDKSNDRGELNNLQRLRKEFNSQGPQGVTTKNIDTGSYWGESYQYEGLGWEFIKSRLDGSVYANFINADGTHSDKSLKLGKYLPDWNRMYFEKPYLFLAFSSGSLVIYNTETHQSKTLSGIRSVGCDSSHLGEIAYSNGVLYMYQSEDWNGRCSGFFKRKLELDF